MFVPDALFDHFHLISSNVEIMGSLDSGEDALDPMSPCSMDASDRSAFHRRGQVSAGESASGSSRRARRGRACTGF
jgi:hypothetical protein